MIGLGNWRLPKLSRCWWWVFLSKDRCLPQCQGPLSSVGDEKHDLSHPYVPISNRSKNHNINVPVSTLTASGSSSASYVMLLSVLRHQKLQALVTPAYPDPFSHQKCTSCHLYCSHLQMRVCSLPPKESFAGKISQAAFYMHCE